MQFVQRLLHPRIASLARAIHDLDIQRVQRLLDKKVNPNSYVGPTPMLFYCITKSTRRNRQKGRTIIGLLLAAGADITITPKGSRRSILHYATEEYDTEVIKLLVHHGASVNARDDSGRTALHYVTENPSGYRLSREACLEIVKFLIQLGADVNAHDDQGYTPLHYAHKCGIEAQAELIRNGADVNAQSKGGLTPLHFAARGGNVAAVPALELIKNGANVNAKSETGCTPLHLAATGDNVPIAELLLSNGADPFLRNNDGNSPLEHLKHSIPEEFRELAFAKKEVVEVLLKYMNQKGRTRLNYQTRHSVEHDLALMDHHIDGLKQAIPFCLRAFEPHVPRDLFGNISEQLSQPLGTYIRVCRLGPSEKFTALFSHAIPRETAQAIVTSVDSLKGDMAGWRYLVLQYLRYSLDIHKDLVPLRKYELTPDDTR